MCFIEQQRVPRKIVTRREEYCCHLRNAKFLGVRQVNLRRTPFPLHWLHSYYVFHTIRTSGLTSFGKLQRLTETPVSSLYAY